MSISILFIELIIIGFQTLIWILLLLFIQLEKHEIVSVIDRLSTESIFIIVICCGYFLGIIIDRLADLFFSKWNQRLKDKIIPNPSINIGTMRYIVVKDNPHLNSFLDYTRSRMRISRATAINIPIIAICSVIFGVMKEYFSFCSGLSFSIIIIGFSIFILAIYTWKNLTIRHLDLIKTCYNHRDK